MKVITAPEYYYVPFFKDEIMVFLAGGITNCENWQKEVIDYLESLNQWETEKLVIFNPRRNKWPKNGDIEEIKRQIEWEYDYLNKCDIFSMYFTNTEKSDQPICFYELGKYVGSSKNYNDHNHCCVISYQEGFKRSFDLEIQVGLVYPCWKEGAVNKNITPVEHAKKIMESYEKLINNCRLEIDYNKRRYDI